MGTGYIAIAAIKLAAAKLTGVKAWSLLSFIAGMDRCSFRRGSQHSTARRRYLSRCQRYPGHRHGHVHNPRTTRVGENGRSDK